MLGDSELTTDEYDKGSPMLLARWRPSNSQNGAVTKNVIISINATG